MTDESYPKLDEVGEDDLPTITDSIKSKLRKRIMDELDGYINEAEHQDGYGYWGQFKTYDEAVNDFGIYLTMILPPDKPGTTPIPNS